MATTTVVPLNETDPECPESHFKDRQYYKFVILSVSAWVTCFLIILIPRIFVFICTARQQQKGRTSKHRNIDQVLVEPSFYSSIQNWAEDLISGNTTTGRILVVFAFVCSILSFVIYIIGKPTGTISTGYFISKLDSILLQTWEAKLGI